MQTLQNLKLAVVGHVEWMTFLAVDALPKPGLVGHAHQCLEEPAGGGAVSAVQMARLSQAEVHFFTALGRDSHGEQSLMRLQQLGLNVHVAWRKQPTRKGVSMVDESGERAITVIGDRLQPNGSDPLPWDRLAGFDGVFATAADPSALRICRTAKILTATPRLSLPILRAASVELDAIIGSGLDPDEQIPESAMVPPPRIRVATEGNAGGVLTPGGRYPALTPLQPIVDSYGCGDSFAAGFTIGLAAGYPIHQAAALGAQAGASCTGWFGPYPNNIEIDLCDR